MLNKLFCRTLLGSTMAMMLTAYTAPIPTTVSAKTPAVNAIRLPYPPADQNAGHPERCYRYFGIPLPTPLAQMKSI